MSTSRCFLRLEELDETRTRSFAYISKFTVVLPSVNSAAFLIRAFSFYIDRYIIIIILYSKQTKQ